MKNTEQKLETSQESQVCKQYHAQLIPEFTNITKENISQRVIEMIVIINRNRWLTSKPIQFSINTQAVITAAMEQITPIIKSNTLVDITSCKIVPKTKPEYRKIARNRLNRNKPKFVGNFVFGPLVFDRLYRFCCKAFGDNGVVAFVSILSDILAPESMIRFKQTRAQPLIPYNTFVFDNAFRNSCTMLLRHYGLEQEWNIATHKRRLNAKDKWQCFVGKCLPQLSQQCLRKDYRPPRCLFILQKDTYSTRTPIITENTNVKYYDINRNQHIPQNNYYRNSLSQNHYSHNYQSRNQHSPIHRMHQYSQNHHCREQRSLNHNSQNCHPQNHYFSNLQNHQSQQQNTRIQNQHKQHQTVQNDTQTNKIKSEQDTKYTIRSAIATRRIPTLGCPKDMDLDDDYPDITPLPHIHRKRDIDRKLFTKIKSERYNSIYNTHNIPVLGKPKQTHTNKEIVVTEYRAVHMPSLEHLSPHARRSSHCSKQQSPIFMVFM